MAVSPDGPASDTTEVSLTTLCDRIAQVLASPEWSPDDGRHLIADVAELTPEELGRLHPFALADTEAMQRRHDRRIDLVVALRRQLGRARYRLDDAVATLERLAEAARYDPLGPAATVTTAVTVLTRCSGSDDARITAAGVRVLRAVHRVLRDRGGLPGAAGSHRAAPGPPAGSNGAQAPAAGSHGAPGTPAGSHRATPGPPAGAAAAAMPWDRPLDLATLAVMPGAEVAWPDVADHLRAAATSRWDASYRDMLTRQSWQELLRLRLAPTLHLDATPEPVLEIALGPDEIPGYRVWLRRLLEEALAHARDVQAGWAPLGRHGAFAESDASLIARAALQALAWDEPWVGTVLSDLLPAVAVPAEPELRPAPSPTLAGALGSAIAGAPTPETVAALEQMLDDVRNPSLRKRLRRSLVTARRHLALRPSRSLREASDGELAAGDLAPLARSLEAGYLDGMSWPLDGWLRHVRAEPRRADLVSRLLWVVTAADGTRLTVRGHPEPGGIDERWIDVDHRPVDLPTGSTVALWHPLPAPADERDRWRQVIWEERVEQPFRQVYREHYQPQPAEPGVLTDLAGAVVDLEPFLEAARDHGWTFERAQHRLVRRVGANWARVDLTYHRHPEAKEANALGPIVLSEDREGHQPWHPGEDRVQRIQVSELLRSVDLMLAGCALPMGDPLERPMTPGLASVVARTWADAVAIRREVVARAIDGLPMARLGATHLHVDGHAIHLRSGFITRDGEQVPLTIEEPPPLLAPWLPHDDVLLRRILAAAGQCSGLAG